MGKVGLFQTRKDPDRGKGVDFLRKPMRMGQRVVIGTDMAEDRVNIIKTETDGAQQDGV